MEKKRESEVHFYREKLPIVRGYLSDTPRYYTEKLSLAVTSPSLDGNHRKRERGEAFYRDEIEGKQLTGVLSSARTAYFQTCSVNNSLLLRPEIVWELLDVRLHHANDVTRAKYAPMASQHGHKRMNNRSSRSSYP